MKDDEFFRIYDDVLKRPACLRRIPRTVAPSVYEAAARLEHPNILAIYQVREQDVITEAVEGLRLSEFLYIPGDRRAFTSRFQEMLIGPLLGALSYAHECGLVHGFLHPGNIWLFPNEQLKVWGFGSALPEAGRTDPGWKFAAPEVRGGEKPGRRSDIWSFGAILHYLFCGRAPEGGVDSSVPDWVQGCLIGRYSSLRELRSGLYPEQEFQMDACEEALLHTTLANNYFRQFRVELAVLEWEKALALHPQERVARNNLGVALWRWGRVEEAAECFRQAGSFFNLGLLLLEQGEFAAAVLPLRTTTVMDPKRAAAYFALGQCLLGLGKLQEGIEEFQKSLILNIQSARTFLRLGEAYERLGRLEDARQYREKALEAKDQDQEMELEPEILETALNRGCE